MPTAHATRRKEYRLSAARSAKRFRRSRAPSPVFSMVLTIP